MARDTKEEWKVSEFGKAATPYLPALVLSGLSMLNITSRISKFVGQPRDKVMAMWVENVLAPRANALMSYYSQMTEQQWKRLSKNDRRSIELCNKKLFVKRSWLKAKFSVPQIKNIPFPVSKPKGRRHHYEREELP